jgi:hypothetical protein
MHAALLLQGIVRTWNQIVKTLPEQDITRITLKYLQVIERAKRLEYDKQILKYL